MRRIRREKNREKERLRFRKYYQENKDKFEKYRPKKDPLKEAARYQLRTAVRKGFIKKPKRCEDCKVVCIAHGHHEDYSKPLDVMWLCSVCHGKKHLSALGERSNG